MPAGLTARHGACLSDSIHIVLCQLVPWMPVAHAAHLLCCAPCLSAVHLQLLATLLP